MDEELFFFRWLVGWEGSFDFRVSYFRRLI